MVIQCPLLCQLRDFLKLAGPTYMNKVGFDTKTSKVFSLP